MVEEELYTTSEWAYKNETMQNIAEGDIQTLIHYLTNENAEPQYETIDRDDVTEDDTVIEYIHEEAKTEEKENEATKTGDDTNVIIYVVAFVLAIALGGFLFVKRKKK